MEIDIDIFHLLNGLAKQSGLLDVIIIFFASPAVYILGIGAMIVMLWGATWKTQYGRVACAALALLLARGIVVPIIRFFYDRSRPFITFPEITTLVTKAASESSFPSGHATIAFALAGAFYYMNIGNKAWWKYAVALAALIAVARVIAGVHYPSDIIVGAFVGWGSAWIVKKYLLPKTK